MCSAVGLRAERTLTDLPAGGQEASLYRLHPQKQSEQEVSFLWVQTLFQISKRDFDSHRSYSNL